MNKKIKLNTQKNIFKITVSATAAQNAKERISLQSKKEKMEKPICCMEWLLRVPLRG